MKLKSFKLLFVLGALLTAITLAAAPAKNSKLDRVKSLQIMFDSTVNIKADSVSQTVVFNSDTSVDGDENMSDEEIKEVIDSVVSPSQSALKLVMKTIVGVVAILCPFAFVLLLFWLIFRYSTSRNRERNKLIELSIRERSPLPDSFYRSEKDYYSRPRRLSSGIVWIGVGLAFVSFFLCVGSDEMACLGLIPLFVGVARIVVYFVGKRDAGQD